MKCLTIWSLFSLFSWMSGIVSLRRVLTWKEIRLQQKKGKHKLHIHLSERNGSGWGSGRKKKHILTFYTAQPLWRLSACVFAKGLERPWRRQWKLISNPGDWQDIRLRPECDTDHDMEKEIQVRRDWMVPCWTTCPSYSLWQTGQFEWSNNLKNIFFKFFFFFFNQSIK